MQANPLRWRRRNLWVAGIAATVVGVTLLGALRQIPRRQRADVPLTIARTPDRHQLAAAILAIATAAIGFGIFGGDLSIGAWEKDLGFARGAQLGKLLGILFAGVFYFLVLLSTSRIFLDEQITGRQLVLGPFRWLYMEMISLAGLYSLNLVEELSVN
ncbi:MAG: hypothetical protein OXU28_04795 [Chloroflexota bacterium]|nr:hypothetical protein [Chloroflexota bacterium]